MPSHPRSSWVRLGELLVRRRIELDPRYSNRRIFTDERIPGRYRIITSLEAGQRDNYETGTLAAIEAAYRLEPGAISRFLAGGELGYQSPPRESPKPSPSRPASASMKLVDEGSTPEQRAPFAWQIEREIEEAERRYGPDPTGEQIFGAGTHEADAWNAPTWDRDETVQMLALFRWFAFRNVGGQSGSKTGLTLART